MNLDNNIETIFKTIKKMNGNSGDIATRIITKKKTTSKSKESNPSKTRCIDSCFF